MYILLAYIRVHTYLGNCTLHVHYIHIFVAFEQALLSIFRLPARKWLRYRYLIHFIYQEESIRNSSHFHMNNRRLYVCTYVSQASSPKTSTKLDLG